MTFERARAVADAVLFEGYSLYPYRPTSTKNQLRFQFGVVAPRAFSEVDRGDPWWTETQCLVSSSSPGAAPARVRGVVRFLRLRRRTIEGPSGERLESLDLREDEGGDGELLIAWDEGEVHEIPFTCDLGAGACAFPFALGADEDVDVVHDGRGALAARVIRARAAIEGAIHVEAEPIAGCVRLRVRVENGTAFAHASERSARDRALLSSLLGTHVLLSVSGEGEAAAFVSLIDPPESAHEAVAACRQTGLWPVLAGDPGSCDVVLAAPIILYDHPQVAPESPGDLFDATEIDEILTLRTRLLTDDEKREARATDARVAALIDRVDAMTGADLARLHGATRELRWSDGRPVRTARLDGVAIAPGSRVRLRPGPRRTDAQDLFLVGMTATVRAVVRDVEDRECLAVTVDDDPGAELHAQRGRYHYFFLDEVEALEG